MIYSDIEDKVFKDKDIQNIKNILEKDHGREFTWEEATQGLRDLRTFAKITYELFAKEIKNKELLEENPQGFHLQGSGSCLICRSSASEKNSWYDKHGLKCMCCQNAINSKVIPASIAKNRESWYSKTDLGSYFNIKGADLNRYVKQSLLKDRIIPGEGKKVHFQIFLIKDNWDVLPPKKLLKSRTVKVMHKGEEYFTEEPWFEFADEKLINRLKKYKILYCLPETLSKPIDSDRLLHKTVNPLFSQKLP